MTTVPAALAWEFWGRHRLGLAAVLALVGSFALYGAIRPMTGLFASISSIWFVMGLFYVIGVFAYGFEGRLESAESGFPVRLFVLPVQTWLLVGWPMLQGIGTAVLLWTIWDRLVLSPAGVETPAWWTAMLAAIVAASQAMVWLPFGLAWLRLLALAATLTILVQAPAVLSLIGDRLAEPAALTGFALSIIPLSFLVAWNGVSRARHGESPDWMRWLQPLADWRRVPRHSSPFRSALEAQTWYEWRRSGRGFIFAVLILIALLMVWGVFVERTVENRTGLAVNFLLLPLIIGSFWSLRMGATGELGRGPSLTAFAGTRPLDNVTFVAAKLRAAAWSAVGVWALVLVLTTSWIGFGGFAAVEQSWDLAVERFGTSKSVAMAVLLAGLIPLLYWRCLIANLWIGLLGRTWVAPVASGTMSTIVLQGCYLWWKWSSDPARSAELRDVWPWLAAFAIALKFFVAGFGLRLLVRRRQLSVSTAKRMVLAWSLFAAALIAALAWVMPANLVRFRDLNFAIILLLPLGRIALAPLALGLNRHR